MPCRAKCWNGPNYFQEPEPYVRSVRRLINRRLDKPTLVLAFTNTLAYLCPRQRGPLGPLPRRGMAQREQRWDNGSRLESPARGDIRYFPALMSPLTGLSSIGYAPPTAVAVGQTMSALTGLAL
jgi:hypothetical protein